MEDDVISELVSSMMAEASFSIAEHDTDLDLSYSDGVRAG